MVKTTTFHMSRAKVSPYNAQKERRNSEESKFLQKCQFGDGEQEVLAVINNYIHNGRNPNTLKVRQTGKTALHYAAEYQYKIVAETLLEHGMNGLTKNKYGETALGVAIKMKSDSIGAVIARYMKPIELRILFGTTWEEDENEEQVEKELDLNETLLESQYDFTETLVVVFDSLRKTLKDGSDVYDVKPLIEDEKGRMPGETNYNYRHHTGFQNIAEKGLKDVVNHPIVRLLIKCKWDRWAKKKHARNFSLHVLSLFCLTFTVAVAATASDVKTYDTSLQRSRVFFEVAVCCFVIKTVVLEIFQIRRHGFRSYFKEFLNWLDLVSASLLLIVFPVRYINTKGHWYIFALGYLLWVIKVFKYAVVFSKSGTYVESLRRIFWKDLIPFSILFCTVNLAFGGTFLLVLKGDGSLETHDDTSSIWGIWYVGLRTMIEAQPIVDYTGLDGYRPAGTIVMIVFMSITIVVLLNILIAQLSDTYHKIQSDARKSVFVNRAWTIARLETNALHFTSKCLQEVRQNRFLACADLKPSQSKEMEDFKSTLTRIEKQLVKTDLKVQTLKSRVRGIGDVHEKLEKVLHILDSQQRNSNFDSLPTGCESVDFNTCTVYFNNG